MIARLFLSALLLAFASPALAQTAVRDCSRTELSRERTLCHEVVVNAPSAEVWRLWTSDEGLRSWLAPVAAIDLRPGGAFETSYNSAAQIGDAANIRNRVIAFTSERLLVIQVAQAPPGFPHADEVRELTTLIEFEPIDANTTRVRGSMLGYRAGEAFDDLYAFFQRGNAYTFAMLQERVASGPVNWSEQR